MSAHELDSEHTPRRRRGGGCDPSPFWERHDDDLRRLAAEGKTTSQAAAILGVSKNAIIGRSHRITGVTWMLSRGPRPPKPVAPKKPAIEFPTAGRCVYPHGDPRRSEFHFCGDAVVYAGAPYCETHAALCWRPDREREAA